jgi:hypothetical protein
VNLLLLLVSIGLLFFFAPDGLSGLNLLFGYTFTSFLKWFFWMNVFLAGFNFLPAYPMDGGRLFRAALTFKMGERQATKVACYTSFFFSGAFILYGFIFDSGLGGTLLVWIGISNIINCMQTLKFGGEVYSGERAGYGVQYRPGTFDAAYNRETPKEPGFFEKKRLQREEKKKAQRRKEAKEKKEELDRILDKISQEGIGSLSEKEKSFLQKQGQK